MSDFMQEIDKIRHGVYNVGNILQLMHQKERTMRIIIDTKNDVIICPKTFWEDIAKANAVLREAGQPEKSHKDEVKRYFESAIKNDLARAADVKKK